MWTWYDVAVRVVQEHTDIVLTVAITLFTMVTVWILKMLFTCEPMLNLYVKLGLAYWEDDEEGEDENDDESRETTGKD